MASSPARSARRTKLLVDTCLFVGFVLVSAPQATGVALHEWISFAFIPVFVLHLLLNWRWIVSVTTRFFRRQPGKTRFNYLWDLTLFVLMTFVIFTGVVISEAALPAVGAPIEIDPFWSAMHDAASNLLLVLVGVHLAMHWSWIKQALRRER